MTNKKAREAQQKDNELTIGIGLLLKKMALVRQGKDGTAETYAKYIKTVNSVESFAMYYQGWYYGLNDKHCPHDFSAIKANILNWAEGLYNDKK